jgi:hypothetical protein
LAKKYSRRFVSYARDSTQSSTTPTLGASGFTAALAVNDIVSLTLTYEAAS